MNPERQILQLSTQPTAPQVPPPEPAAPGPSPQPPAADLEPCLFSHRGNGKIAHLPKSVRDQVNNMLLDGVPYPEIIQRLGDAGKDLNPGHIHEWYKRHHQDLLQQRAWLELVTSRTDFSTDILATPDTINLHEAGLRLAADHMLDRLARFAFATANTDPNAQPEIFARLVNALSRLTREALAFQKYHDASARDRQNQLQHFPPTRDLNDLDHDLFLKKAEEFFHRKILRAPAAPPPSPPPPAPSPSSPPSPAPNASPSS